jgi:Tripartite tricarboxylate transporter TctB family
VSRHELTAKLPSLVLALVAAVYVWMSYDYDPASRSLPWIAGVLAIVLASIDAASKRSSDAAARTQDATRAAHPPRREAVMFGWIGAFLVLVVVLGFYAAIPLYVFCYLRIYARKSAAVSAATAFGVVGFLYAVFGGLMGYEIFGGLIAGDYL